MVPISPSSSFRVTVLFIVSTSSTMPPPGAFHLSPMFISTLLYLSSGTSKNLLSLSDSNSALASPSISPPKPSNPGEKSFPIWAPFSNVIRPMAMSSYFLERNSFLLLNAENTLRSVASLRSILLIMSITVPPPNPDITPGFSFMIRYIPSTSN